MCAVEPGADHGKVWSWFGNSGENIVNIRGTATPVLAVTLMQMDAPTLHREMKTNTGTHISGVMMRRLLTTLAQAPGKYP